MTNIEEQISSYVESLHPIIYLNHFDFKVMDDCIGKIAEGVNCIEYNSALGFVDFFDKHRISEEPVSLYDFLNEILEEGLCCKKQCFIILKDIHTELDNPAIIALLRRIAEFNLYKEEFNATVFIMSDILVIPQELEHYITVVDMPLPDKEEIKQIIIDYANGIEINVKSEIVDEIALSFKGLNKFQIQQILNLAYHDGGDINNDDKKLILKEKEQFIKKSGMLEIVNFKETINDIGGLENLKDWLKRKAHIFKNLDKALKFGVDVPKGIMIVGMPGCGKSLAAKATASLFEIPLVRLDVGRLLGKYVGESESNMRKALSLSEAISPCVLWIDEIEKAFSGVGSASANEVTTRLFGQFLTWMQEKDNTVFIVATANDISQIPAEFLRKGRFDELFSVSFPNGYERSNILQIHLKKRKKWNANIDINRILKETKGKGYNGADLEAAVKDAIEKAFVENRDLITTDDLIKSIKDIKPIFSVLGEKVKKTKELLDKLEMKKASVDDPLDEDPFKNN